MRIPLHRWALSIILCIGGLASIAGCNRSSSKESAPKGVRQGPGLLFPVEVLSLSEKQVEYTVTAVGSVEAYERVQITARVAGVIERVRFREGDVVRQGKVLAEIEPQKYALSVESARATLEKNKAAQSEAKAGVERRESALKKTPGLIPEEEVETWRTKGQVSSAEVAQAQAELKQASLNLRDAFVRSPISGTIETRTVETGQYVQPGTVLGTLVQRNPLLLRFQVTEAEAAHLKPDMTVQFHTRDDQNTYTAAITHVAQAADETSRLVPIIGEVDAKIAEALRPGTFAEVTVPVGAPAQALVVPQTAIRPGEKGFVGFVVDNDKAYERILTLGMRTADGLVEVRAGLKAGELLVVRGAEALRDGVKVKISR